MLSSFLRLQADAIKAITAAAGVEVEPYWPALFEKFLAGKDIGEMLSNVGSGAGAPAAAAAGGGGGAAAAAAEPEPEPEEEEEAEDMGFDLFD